MPELPEVETVRLSLIDHVIGLRVKRVDQRRPQVIHGRRGDADLLQRYAIEKITRHGKQLAIFGTRPDKRNQADRPIVSVHLGMTGSLRYLDPKSPQATGKAAPHKHDHVVWHFNNGSLMVFRDPRRFGGIWTLSGEQALHDSRWRKLGDDALLIRPGKLHHALGKTTRAIKAALLDQHLIAGLGNIYVDELLFKTGIHPMTPAFALPKPTVTRLVRNMRPLLARAIRQGGSSTSDYVNADGQSGNYQNAHKVYGRAGQPCTKCGEALSTDQVAGRTTVWCVNCQPLQAGPG